MNVIAVQETREKLLLDYGAYSLQNILDELEYVCRPCWIDPLIDATTYDQDEIGKRSQVFALYRLTFEVQISPNAAVSALQETGLRPASTWELAAFACIYPDVGLKYPVVALGEHWVDKENRINGFPCLTKRQIYGFTRRCLKVRASHLVFLSNFRFLLVGDEARSRSI